MALFGKLEGNNIETKAPVARPFWHQLLVIPEATLLLAMLIIGWAFNFPVFISLLIVLIIGVFVVRLLLLSTATQRLQRGAYGQADRLSGMALRMNPWSVDTLHVHAQTFVMRGDDIQAEPFLRRAIALAPQQHTVHATMTAVLLEQGEIEQAQVLLEQSRQGEQLSPAAVQQLAWYTLHVEGNPLGAQLLVEGAYPEQLAEPIAVALLVTLAESELALHNTTALERTLGKINQRLPLCPPPQQAELHFHLGRLEGAMGRDARAHFRQCVALDPQGRYARQAWRNAIGNTTLDDVA